MANARPSLLVGFVALALLAFHWAASGPLSVLREKAFDTYQIIAPIDVPLDQVAVIAIDEASLAQYGRWPWPRSQMSDVVDAAGASGAAAIGLDLLFPEAENEVEDGALATVLARNPTVLAMTLSQGVGAVAATPKAGFSFVGSINEMADGYDGGTAPVTVLADAASGLGIVRSFADADGSMRAIPLVWAERSADGTVRHWPAMSVELLRVAQDERSITVRIGGDGEDALRVGQVTVPLGDGRLRLADAPGEPLRVSAADLLKTGEDERLNGRIVLIAVDAAGLDRYHLTPRGSLRLGADLHAIAVGQMLAGISLTEANHARWWERGIFALGALLLAGLFALGRKSPWLVGAAGLVLALAPLGIGFWLYRSSGVLLDGAQPSAGLLACGVAGGYALYREAEHRRGTLQKQFSQFLSPEVVRRLAASDTEAKLAVEDRMISVLLVDIRGFTAMSEKLGGARIVDVVNHFFAIASEEIFARDGTVDKYMGDAVLAFWNAPFDQDDHAQRALDCAQAIVARVERDNGLLERKGLPAIRAVAIVDSGLCSVGNMGTRERVDYTAIGPTVNAVARLEKEAKMRELEVAAGPGMAAFLADQLVKIDDVELRGFDAPVGLFAPKRQT